MEYEAEPLLSERKFYPREVQYKATNCAIRDDSGQVRGTCRICVYETRLYPPDSARQAALVREYDAIQSFQIFFRYGAQEFANDRRFVNRRRLVPVRFIDPDIAYGWHCSISNRPIRPFIHRFPGIQFDIPKSPPVTYYFRAMSLAPMVH
jgi:hypothetical protein